MATEPGDSIHEPAYSFTPAQTPANNSYSTIVAESPTYLAGGAPAMWPWFLALLGWTTLLATYALTDGSRFDATEAWVAQSAREMRDTGEYIVPQFAGQPFPHRSPGACWAVILASWLRRTPVDTASARIPNALAAVIIVAMIFLLARRIAGDRAAVFAGFSASASVFILYGSHRANAEMGLACCITVSLASMWLGSTFPKHSWKHHWLFMLGYFAAGVGMIYQLPMPVLCVGVPAFLWLLLRNRWRVLASGWHILGIFLFLLPWLPWAIALYWQEPTALERWRAAFVDHFTGTQSLLEEPEPWMSYVAYLLPPLLFCLPFTLSLPLAVARPFRKRQQGDRDGMFFMLIWFFGLLVFFTAATGSEPLSFLSALPPLFVLLGVELAAFFDPDRLRRQPTAALGVLVVWIGLPVGALAGLYGVYRWHRRYAFFEWVELWRSYAVAAVIVVVGLSLAAWLYKHRRQNGSFATIVGTMWIAWLWVWPSLMPMLESRKPAFDFAEQLRDRLSPEMVSGLRNVGAHEPGVVWLTDYRYPRVTVPLELQGVDDELHSVDFERRALGKEMARLLEQPETALLVTRRPKYIEFMLMGPGILATEGRAMPPTHLWLQSRYGSKSRRLILFGNQPPPWEEPALDPPSGLLGEQKKGTGLFSDG